MKKTTNLRLVSKENSFDKRKLFSLLLPPPNVTGKLHFGHFLDHTIADVCAKWYSLVLNYNINWIPVVDHAGIATENVAKKNGFYTNSDINKFANKNKKFILSQIKNSGIALNWDNGYRYTLDNQFKNLTTDVLTKLVNDQLLYIGNYVVNWCYKCSTALSDEEICYTKLKNKLYYIKYFYSKNKFICVATTRPETIMGDIAVVTSKKNHFSFVNIPMTNKKIPIIQYDNVSDEYGTGYVKCTPFHSKIDYKICKELNLNDEIEIFNEKGQYVHSGIDLLYGKEVYDARKCMVELLQKDNYIEKIENVFSNIPTCYRCGNVTDYRISKQIFLNMKKLSKKFVEKYKENSFRCKEYNLENEINLFPSSVWSQTNEWLKNLQDWCISRQIKFGYKVILYYCSRCYKVFLNKKCKCCSKLVKYSSVLDTWFTSSLCTLALSKDKIDLLVTGRDILFFWVLRMYFMNMFFSNKYIIKKVFFHGLIRDKQGRKLSKSLNNSPDLEEYKTKHGNDAIRYGILLAQKRYDDFKCNFDTLSFEYDKLLKKIISISNFLLKLNRKKVWITSYLPHAGLIDKQFIDGVIKKYIQEMHYHIDYVDTRKFTIRVKELIYDRFSSEYLEIAKTSPYSTYQGKLLSWGIILKILKCIIPDTCDKIWKKHFFGDFSSIVFSSFDSFKATETTYERFIRFIECVKGINNIAVTFKHKSDEIIPKISPEFLFSRDIHCSFLPLSQVVYEDDCFTFYSNNKIKNNINEFPSLNETEKMVCYGDKGNERFQFEEMCIYSKICRKFLRGVM